MKLRTAKKLMNRSWGEYLADHKTSAAVEVIRKHGIDLNRFRRWHEMQEYYEEFAAALERLPEVDWSL